MSQLLKVNNERSETIELIKLMDSIVKRNTWHIKSVGGESTLNSGKKRMFPDVLLYGDSARTHILQGWEVKMPNTPISDIAFVADAKRKADVLGVNSCVVWNFASCIIYSKVDGIWQISRTIELRQVRNRADVTIYREYWEAVVTEILSEINSFFVSGKFRHAKLGDIITDTVMTELIKRNNNILAEHIQAEAIKNTVIESYISHWWRSVEKEYKFDGAQKFSVYAKYILINWINKITFAHMILNKHTPAMAVKEISEKITPLDGAVLFLIFLLYLLIKTGERKADIFKTLLRKFVVLLE